MAVASLYAAVRCLDVKNFRTLLENLNPDVPWVSLRLVVAGTCKLSATDAFMRILARHDRTFLNIDLGNMGIPLGLAVLNASFGLVDCLLFEGSNRIKQYGHRETYSSLQLHFETRKWRGSFSRQERRLGYWSVVFKA